MRQGTEEDALTNASIPSLIARFAFPAILSNLVASIYNIADQIFIGQKVGTLGNAATNIVFPLVLLMTTLFTMLGSGGSSRFSLYQGSGKQEKAEKIVGNTLTALAVSGTVLMAVTLLFLHPLLELFGARGETLDLAVEYTRIIAIGMPFQIFGAGASMLIRADGSPRYAMTSTLVGAVLNVILDPIFIFKMKLGMTGAALATVLGQFVSALITLRYFRTFKSVPLHRDALIPVPGFLKEICILGLPAGLMQIAVMAVQIVMNNTLGHYGELTAYGRDIPLAVSGVVTKVTSILTATVMGICQSCQPIFGYNYGIGNSGRVKETFCTTAAITTVVSAVFELLLQLFPHQILEIFQQGDASYLSFGTGYLRIFMGGVILNGIAVLASVFFPSIGIRDEQNPE